MPEKRTITVFGCLVAGATLVSSALFLLEPGQHSPLPAASLSSLDTRTSESPEKLLLSPLERDGQLVPSAQRWTKIVVHDSNGISGSLQDLDRAYRPYGLPDAGYHLVINNGSGKPAGTIEATQRWRNTESGAFVTGPNADWWNRHAVGVCLIGNAADGGFTPDQVRELEWVLTRLCDRLGIAPADVHFTLSGGVDATFSGGTLQVRPQNR